MSENKKRIEDLLKENPRGLTIQEISDESKLARNTVKIILVELKGEDKIEIREIGKAKLNYWRGKI